MDQQAGSQRPTPVNPGVISLPWRDLWLLLALFIAFRAMTLFAFRPGGLVLDYSDFYYYRDYAQTTRQGYFPFINLWAPYPPLFPLLMTGLWWVSTLLPPWEFSNLWFTLLLGGILLLFESGNLVLVYAIAGRLGDRRSALRSAGFYALLFAPVYTGTGWFDSLPIFFFLLGVYLLLRGRPLWSALVCGVGFMIKIIPVILLPIGLRLPYAGLTHSSASPEHTAQKATGQPARRQLTLPWLNVSLDIRHALLYLGTFVVTLALIGLAFYAANARLVWGSLLMNETRAPWQTVWALLEGNFGYGVVPLDSRDLSWQPGLAAGSLPWPLITALFAGAYLFIYTRPFDWKQPRNVVAMTGFTVTLFMLYSKGYSPQFLGWVLVFIALLLPNLRGAFYAVVLGLANLIEANLFFTIVPDEHWLLMLTVGLRTLIFALVSAECAFILRPLWFGPRVRRAWRGLLIALAAALVIGSVPASVRFVQAYFDVRHQLSPYRATIDLLRQDSQPGEVLILNSYDHTAYNWLFPYLRDRLTFYMLDDYAPPGESVEVRTTALLEQIAGRHREWWFFDTDPAKESPSEAVMARWLQTHAVTLTVRDIDRGRLSHLSLE